MSSIVSRRPPVLGSVSQAKDFRWIAIRLGTSRTLSRRAKLRRVRGASTVAKAAPRDERLQQEASGPRMNATSQDSTGDTSPCGQGDRRSRTPPLRAPYVAEPTPFGRLRLSVDRGPVYPGLARLARPVGGRSARSGTRRRGRAWP